MILDTNGLSALTDGEPALEPVPRRAAGLREREVLRPIFRPPGPESDLRAAVVHGKLN